MDRLKSTNDVKQTIYEIYRACRLCGAGAGYKMPIIQNVVDLDGSGVELRQKIKECVQIEVNHTDRMPPLICELCVDKVNDFYQFLALCKQTNVKTRLRLGLPLQTKSKDASVHTIHEETEPLDNIPNAKPLKSKTKNVKVKKEPVEVKMEPRPPSRESSEERRWTRESRARRTSLPHPTSPVPRRTTRQQDTPSNTQTEEAKKRRELEESAEKSKLKRPRDKEPKDTPPPNKKPKITPETAKPGPKSSKTTPKEPAKPQKPPLTKPAPKNPPKPAPPPKTKPAPKTTKVPEKAKVETVKPYFCYICNIQAKTSQGFAQHNTKHYPTFTSPRHACNACEEWFCGEREALAHHRAHRAEALPYRCSRCYGYFKLQAAYEDHFAANLCLSVYEVPDAQCPRCWRPFPTAKLLEEHRCAGEDARPGGKCSKCSKNYALLKNLVKHESACNIKKKGEMSVEASVSARLLPMRVRLARCDALLHSSGPVHCSTLHKKFGLDSRCTYPYLNLASKPPPHMVTIPQHLKEEFPPWDSDNHSDDSNATQNSQTVDTLSTISLKTILSKKCLGSKRRSFEDLSKKIGSIIDGLGDETMTSYDSDSILGNSVSGDHVTGDKKDSDDVDSVNDGNDSVSNDKDSVAKPKCILSDDIIKSLTRDNQGKRDDSQTSCSDDSNSILDKNNDIVEKTENLSQDVDTNNDKSHKVQSETDRTIIKESKCGVKTENDDRNTEESDVSTLLAENDEASNDTKSLAEDDVANDSPKTSIENDIISNEDSQTLIEKDLASIDEPTIDEPTIDNDTTSNDSHSLIDNDMASKYAMDESRINDKGVNNDLKDDDQNNDYDSISKDKVSSEHVDSVNKFNQNDFKITDHQNDSDTEMDIDHTKESEKSLENNDNFSKINEITNKILKENETKENHSDSISLNSIKSGDANGFNNHDRFNVNDSSDDDRKLMAVIDAQLGEDDGNHSKTGGNDNKIGGSCSQIRDNNHRIGENDNVIGEIEHKIGGNDHKNVQKSHLIDDLLRKQGSDLRSLDLDSISDDDYNFDA